MITLVIRLIVNSFSIWVASLIVAGIELNGSIWQFLLVGLVFGLVNALIKPILAFFSTPLIVLTLGLFTLILNALLLWLVAWLAGLLTEPPVLVVNGFIAALLGSLVISLISWALSFILPE